MFDFDELGSSGETPNDESRPAEAHTPPRRIVATGSGDRWFHGLIGLLVGIALALGVVLLWPDTAEKLTRADIDDAVESALADQADEPSPAALVFERIAPSLVVVRAVGGESTGSADAAGTNIGGGVVINDQGQILTANHIVETAASIEVVLADGTQRSAELVTSDPDTDIAVLEAFGPTGTVTPAVIGNSRTTRIGDPVYAVGNPLGLTGSISAGVISGLNRSIPFPGDDERILHDLMQFDAAVNQGNSGGPLLNDQGQVIGIVTALADASQQGYFIGIGFAVPIDIAAGGAAEGPAQ